MCMYVIMYVENDALRIKPVCLYARSRCVAHTYVINYWKLPLVSALDFALDK